MKRYNWRQATKWLQRQGTAALVATAVIGMAASPALADIVPNGDVSPDNLGDDLPFGGEVPGGLLVVGGTGAAIGGTASGQLTIDIPSDTDPLTADNGYVGRNAQGNGLIRVVSLNSELVFSNRLVLGEFGRGTLEVASGARVATNGGGGSASFDLVLGNQLTGQGLAVVEGDSSLLLSVNTGIGGDGFGSIEVYNRGSLVSINSAVVGNGLFGDGSVLLDGSFTNWIVGFDDGSGAGTFDGELIVGNNGSGAVVIQNQARAQVLSSTVIGAGPLGYGEVVVNGRNSALSTGSLVVGGDGTAFLNIEDRGFVRSLSDTEINSQGFINLAEGTLFSLVVNNNGGVIRGSGTVSAPIVVNGGDIRNAAGVANVRERLLFTGAVTNNDNIESIGGEMEFLGAVVNTGANSEIYAKNAILRFRGGLTNNPGATIYLDNTIFERAAFTNDGNLVVLPSTASTMMADVTLAATSILDMTLGNNGFSQLIVTGGTTLGGILDLNLASSYAPQPGDSFEILKGTSIAGTFSSIVSPGSLWAPDYSNPTSVVVTYMGVAPVGIGADFNGDGIVDGDDLAVWKANFGKGSNPPPFATQAEGDANGDGVVDGNDYMIIQRRWGGPPAVIAAEGALAAVPEPSSLVLALAALALPAACRRRRT